MSEQTITVCRSCFSIDLVELWKLAKTPYGDLFKLTKSEALSLHFHSLNLVLCQNCNLLQLSQNPSFSEIYSSYLYRTAVTNSLTSFYSQVVNRLTKEYQVDPGRLALDIGSNDGSYLLNFLELGFRVLGIEPTENSAKLAESKGIETYNDFFNRRVVDYVKSLNKPIGHISINYTLANVENIYEFFDLIGELMDSHSIMSVISGYHPDQFSLNMFEYINHDHVSYFTLTSFQNLCERAGLRVLDVTRFEHKGGSIQFVVAKESSPYKVQSSVYQLAQREFLTECNTSGFVNEFKERVERNKLSFHEIIHEVPYKEFVGIGASISTTHLCYQFDLKNFLLGLYDDDLSKVGKFSPGIGLPVHPLTKVAELKGELPIILAWQHTNRILSRLKEIGYSGQVLLPLPKPKILLI